MQARLKNVALIAGCVILIAVLCAALLYHSLPTPYRDTVLKYADEYGVAPSLIYAVIKAESNFDPTAVSPAGAKGLAQLTDDTARYAAGMIGIEYHDGDSFDAEKNIRLSVCYLRYLLNKYDGDLRPAVAAYNAGEGNVDRWIASGNDMRSLPFGETDRYLRRVQLYKRLYELMYSIE